MIVRLDKEQQKQARRQLLNNVVYILSHDTLKQMQSDGLTSLSPVEVFLSAQEFCKEILALPDMTEGLNDEIEDLEEECEGKNETAIILTVASVQMHALSKGRIGDNYREVVLRILEYLDDYDQLLPLVEQMTRKEESRWIEGKKSDLLNYELQQIVLEGGGSEDVRKLFEDFVGFADNTDTQSIKEALTFLNWYNNHHNHSYDNEIASIYEKLGIKSKKQLYINEYNATKNVENEILKVESGGNGVVKNYNNK